MIQSKTVSRRDFCQLGTMMGVSASVGATALANPLPREVGPLPYESPGTMTFRIGTYTGGDSQGIYRVTQNVGIGQLQQDGLLVKAEQPSFLASSRRSPRFFAVGEVNQSATGGTLSCFSTDVDGQTTLLAQRPTLGAHPCHVSLNEKEDLVAVANYSGGSYTVYQIKGNQLSPGYCYQNSGSGPNTARQEGPHGHCVRFLPGNKDQILAADLGTDQLLLFQVTREEDRATLQRIGELSMTAGAGPRQIDFHPEKPWIYVINELSSTLAHVQMPNENDSMKLLHETSTLPADFAGQNTTAHVQVHPNGRFVYGSNRGHDSIAIFRIDLESGTPTLIGHQKTNGRTPRHFLVEPTGQFLLVANQDSDNLVVFPIDAQTGLLGPSQFQCRVPKPVCVMPEWT